MGRYEQSLNGTYKTGRGHSKVVKLPPSGFYFGLTKWIFSLSSYKKCAIVCHSGFDRLDGLSIEQGRKIELQT